MTSMRQVWRALPRPNPIKCACCIVFGCVLPIFPALLNFLGLSNARNVAAIGS